MQVPDELMAEASLYLTIVAGGIVFQGLYFSLVASFRGHSWTKATMVVSLVMNIFHIGSNALFDFWLYVDSGFRCTGGCGFNKLQQAVRTGRAFLYFSALLKGENITGVSASVSVENTAAAIVHRNSFRWGLSYQLSQVTVMKMVNLFGLIVINTKVYVYILATFCYIYSVPCLRRCRSLLVI